MRVSCSPLLGHLWYRTNGIHDVPLLSVQSGTAHAGLTVTSKEENTVALFSCVNTPDLGVEVEGVAEVVRPVVVLILAGLNRIKTPQPMLKEQQRK